MLRQLMQSSRPETQPFVVSGSGTLGWDFVAANLVERGDDVLVLHTGYFADSFADCFETYGINATQLKAPIGDRPQLPDVEQALKEKNYKLITVTHVDTSTGVLSEVKALSELVHRVSPETLVVVDGVCSAGSEDVQFDEWGIDAVLTASQKAIGCPAGLCIMMYSGRALERSQNRTTPPGSYFASIKNWLPSMFYPFLFPLWPPLHSTMMAYTNSGFSHAKLRGKESQLLCHTEPSANSRSSHKSDSDTCTTSFRTVCHPP